MDDGIVSSNSGLGNDLGSGDDSLDLSAFELPDSSQQPSSTTPQVGGQTGAQQSKLPEGQIMIGNVPFTIDQEYRHLPVHEGVYRTQQRSRDKVNTLNNQLTERVANLEGNAAQLELLTADPNFARVFMQEVHPDLMGNFSPEEMIKRDLVKEFGAEFQFSKEEADNDPTSPSARYIRRLAQLEQRYSETGEQMTSVKDFLKKRNEEMLKVQEANESKITDLRRKHNIDDYTFGRFKKFAMALLDNPEHLWKVYVYNEAKKGNLAIGAGNQNPNLAFSSGGPGGTTIEQQLDQIFGKPPSGMQ
jgi:hypothetical protein